MIYVMMLDGAIVSYAGGPGRTTCFASSGNQWHLYYRDCACKPCVTAAHHQFIAYVAKDQVRSIGFTKPIMVDGAPLTWVQRYDLKRLAEWLGKRKKLPAKITRLTALATLTRLGEAK